MSRARSPNRDKAFEIYKQYNGEILLKDIATQLDVSESTVRSWKNRYKWDNEISATSQKNKCNVANEKVIKENKKTHTKKLKKIENSLSDELTEKQRLFCIYYIENFNATKAYQKAYDCDYQTARRCGSRLLTNVDIKKEIDKLTNECLEEQEINSKLLSKRIFQKYIDIAFANITDYITFGKQEREGEFGSYTVNYVDLKDSNNVDGSLISEVSQGKDGIKIKLQDKMKALQWLSDRTDMLSDKDRYKLDLEITKTELAMLKQGGDEGEVEDDGFIEALKGTIDEVWSDDE
ncbi:MAG: terminase small subunit [Clostridiales bacterium]|nr:terminase small subunit [Clostridiales bacterium]